MRRIGLIGIVFLVVLRLAIGWQLMYEGLWKLNTLSSPTPWTSEPYLKNAQGPLRDHFRGLSGDPDDLNWLDYDKVAARWDRWAADFDRHYHLSATQSGWINEVMNGPADFRSNLEALPEGVTLPENYAMVMTYDATNKQLVCSGKNHMTPEEKNVFLKLVADKDQNDESVKKYKAAVNDVFNKAQVLSYKEQALVAIKGNPAKAGINWTQPGQGENAVPVVIEKRPGEIELLKEAIHRYENKIDHVVMEYQYNHLDYEKSEIAAKRLDTVAPVKKIESDLKWRAQEFLTTEQLKMGSVARPFDQQEFIDKSTMWGLTILGAMLIAGFWTRFAALGAAVLVMQFYLAYPPIPGYPEVPGTEHSVIVNKNLIEVLVLCAFIFLPSGMWFGIDAIFGDLFKGKSDEAKDKAATKKKAKA
jgi:uncharacterized membrane protein YphA (DoxX/SURF4 family)